VSANRRDGSAPAAWRQIGIRIPDVISARLDGLLISADRAALRTSRRELLAALVQERLGTPQSDAVRRYRTARPSEAHLKQHVGRVRAPSQRPGPRGSGFGLTGPILPDRTGDEDPTRIVDCPTSRVGLALPTVLLERLGQAAIGMPEERPSRTELIAALILGAPEDGDTLAEIVRAFRRA